MNGKRENSAVVETLKIGGTKIKICVENCRDRSPEEISMLLDQIVQQTVCSVRWSLQRPRCNEDQEP